MRDPSFNPTPDELQYALNLLFERPHTEPSILPEGLPDRGMGEIEALARLAPHVLGEGRFLGGDLSLDHMDPPTPWVTWATTLWNASLNQNLLHPDLSPFATHAERRVVDWLAPAFGMAGGHMTPGSTVSNLTALWAAREVRGVRKVVASIAAHLSVPKAAHILGLNYQAIETDALGRLDEAALPTNLTETALVLTAGTTNAGTIDALNPTGEAAWVHIDAAWAGPLRLSERYGQRLSGIERADSVAISAHKWMFQPKESALILFRDVDTAHAAISFGGAYLAVPNAGVLGSRGAVAIPLLATLLAWGREGVAERIDRAMAQAQRLSDLLSGHPRATVFGPNASGVILWRPRGGTDAHDLHARLPKGLGSTTRIRGDVWIRHVAANPEVDIDAAWGLIAEALKS